MSSFITSLLMPIYIFLGMASPIAVGTSLTTINGSDTLSASRTVINDNFTAMNNGKIENSTTSLPLLTSASGLATVGTITSGTWNATAIGVSKGGTGTTSPTQYHIMAGGGSSGLSAISPGSAGMFLTSNGASAYPTFQSASVDQTQAYTWTGLHTFNTGGFINNASSTFTSRVRIPASSSNKLVLNGVDTEFPSANSVGYLYNNGSGVYSIAANFCTTSIATLSAATTTINHNLNQTPTSFHFEATDTFTAGGSTGLVTSFGTGVSATNQNAHYVAADGLNVGTARKNTKTGAVIAILTSGSADVTDYAVVSALTSTTFTIERYGDITSNYTWTMCK